MSLTKMSSTLYAGEYDANKRMIPNEHLKLIIQKVNEKLNSLFNDDGSLAIEIHAKRETSNDHSIDQLHLGKKEELNILIVAHVVTFAYFL